MKLRKTAFGTTPEGTETTLYVMENDAGMQVSVTDYGASLVRMQVPDKRGALRDMVLGFDSVEGYVHNSGSIGCFVGRSCNRIGGAEITIGGKTYALDANDGKNNLHGGRTRWANKMFSAAAKAGTDRAAVSFGRRSPDGEQGFPGNVDVTVSYVLEADNTLRIIYEAAPDQETILNFTNHAYFNPDGADGRSVLDALVWINAEEFTPTDDALVPTGEIRAVSGTALDFRAPKTLGRDIGCDPELLGAAGGYDHNFVLKTAPGQFGRAASVAGADSGITMEVYTDMPGLQMYTANGLHGTPVPGRGNVQYSPRCAVCFETQYFPDACHHSDFPSPIHPGGELWQSVTEFRFRTDRE